MDLLKIYLDSDKSLQITISPWLIAIGILALVIWLIISWRHVFNIFRSVEIDQIELGIGDQKVTIKPNLVDMQIAYKLWVEISTRKIGLPIDYNNDVIVEVYDSWYEFFKITRELIKEIPISKIDRSKDTRQLVEMAIAVLNQGLRPHLTTWQAKFRRWYESELENKKSKISSPQDIQKKYKHYAALKTDMEQVNKRLIKYRSKLERIFKDEN